MEPRHNQPTMRSAGTRLLSQGYGKIKRPSDLIVKIFYHL